MTRTLRLPRTAALVRQVLKAQKDRKVPLVLLALQEPLASKVQRAILETREQQGHKGSKDLKDRKAPLVLQAPKELKDLLALLDHKAPLALQDLKDPLVLPGTGTST